MVSGLLIHGSEFTDERGALKFFNELDLGEIVRMYQIEPADTEQLRAWQGHQSEKKWFYCISGSFIVNLVEIDNFDNPSEDLVPISYLMKADKPEVLVIPGGYANGFRALEEDSRMLVFSNLTLEDSKNDDFRYRADLWKANWKNSI